MDRAAFWALRAAYNGYPPAMRLIASIYQKGTWKTQDKKLAAAWSKRANRAENNAKTQ
jgi:TPR repeat protein